MEVRLQEHVLPVGILRINHRDHSLTPRVTVIESRTKRTCHLPRTIKAWAADNKVVWDQRRFETSDLDGVFLTVVATPVKSLNKLVSEEAQKRQILCNVVRDRPLCDFYYPAVVRRGPLQIAISTAGHSGALAQWLRKQMESQFGPEWESWLRWLGEARTSLYDDPLSPRTVCSVGLFRLTRDFSVPWE